MILYRIEHPETQLGLFSSQYINGIRRDHLDLRNICADTYDRHSQMNGMLFEFDDNVKDIMNYHCAYKSLEWLLHFVPVHELVLIASVGYKAYKLEATVYHLGRQQAIFKKESLTLYEDITAELLINHNYNKDYVNKENENITGGVSCPIYRRENTSDPFDIEDTWISDARLMIESLVKNRIPLPNPEPRMAIVDYNSLIVEPISGRIKAKFEFDLSRPP